MAEEEQSTKTQTLTLEDDEETEKTEETEKWVKHYSSLHQILLVGDGDFSFSLCLAQSFGTGSNIVATSLDKYDDVIKKYNKAKENIVTLQKLGAAVIHGVDATKMKLHPDLKMRKFDRIIYNFPHAGFYGKEDQLHLIKMHRQLVEGFFRNASHMLRPYGEVHVSHKTKPPYNHWNLEELASGHKLKLTECVDFKIEDYPGYNNKKGAGAHCDKPFSLGKCSTYKFVFSKNIKKMTQQIANLDYSQTRQSQVQELQTAPLMRFDETFNRPPYLQFIPSEVQHQVPFNISFHNRDSHINIHASSGNLGSLFAPKVSEECARIFDGYFKHAVEMFGKTGYPVGEVVQETLKTGFDRYMTGGPGRTINGYIMHLEELRNLSVLRSAWLHMRLLEHDKRK